MIVSEYILKFAEGPFNIPEVTIRATKWEDGKAIRWGVYKHGAVLNKKGSWDYEPLPSSRSAHFLKTHRFLTPEKAKEAYEKRKHE